MSNTNNIFEKLEKLIMNIILLNFNNWYILMIAYFWFAISEKLICIFMLQSLLNPKLQNLGEV